MTSTGNCQKLCKVGQKVIWEAKKVAERTKKYSQDVKIRANLQQEQQSKQQIKQQRETIQLLFYFDSQLIIHSIFCGVLPHDSFLRYTYKLNLSGNVLQDNSTLWSFFVKFQIVCCS